jgi:hypothetical protein
LAGCRRALLSGIPLMQATDIAVGALISPPMFSVGRLAALIRFV